MIKIAVRRYGSPVARTADHDLRRAQLARATEHLIHDDGLDSVTVARVAAHAGVSVGLVQHYFPSKDELLLFAHRSVLDRVQVRVARHIADGVAHRRAIASVVFDCLLELLPIDPDRRGEYEVVQAFLGRGLDNANLARVAAATAADLRAQLATAVSNGKECGEVAIDLDAEHAAVQILAVTDGLALRLHQEPGARVGRHRMLTTCRAILRQSIAGVFTGRCRQYSRS